MRTHTRSIAVLLGFAVVFSTLQIARASRQSATWDEPMHLTAGYAAASAGDFRVDPSHPPLARMWAALPLVFSRESVDTSAIDHATPHDWLSQSYTFARTFVSSHDIDRTIRSGRAMTIVFGVLLGWLVFAWAFEWKGAVAAVLALVLYTLEPNIAAHTALITTDGGTTLFVFGAVYFLWRYVRRGRAWDLAALSICTALACVTKFSAVLLAPIILLLIVFAVVDRQIRPLRAMFVPVVVAATTLLTIWAAYAFRYAPSTDPAWLLTPDAYGGSVDASWVGAMFDWLDAHRLLPNAYAQGFIFSLVSARDLPAFLAGDVQSGGWWYYFPVAIALKTPLALLALCAGGVILAMKRTREAPMTLRHAQGHPERGRGMTFAFVFVPIAVWLVAAGAAGVNIGLRHVLPVYPFLVLVAGIGAAEFMKRRGVRRVLAIAALVAIVAEVARAEPFPLSFFNGLAGGPANGFRYLADSNLGWGGTLKGLQRWMADRHVPTINLAYFGGIDPEVYGVRATYLPSSATFLADRFRRPELPGYVAISGTALAGVYLPAWWQRFYAGFREREPVAVIDSLRIYWVDRWPESIEPMPDLDSLRTLADALVALRWPEHAIQHYREYLQRAPRDPDAWNGLSIALAQTGRTSDAIAGFQRVLEISPADPNARRNIALLTQVSRVSLGTDP